MAETVPFRPVAASRPLPDPPDDAPAVLVSEIDADGVRQLRWAPIEDGDDVYSIEVASGAVAIEPTA